MTPTPCPHCGMPLYPDDRFCVGCGEPAGTGPSAPAPRGRTSRIEIALNTGGHAALASCPTCASEMLPGDRFCQACGAALT